MPFIENLIEFKARMDCPCTFIEDRWLFENGAESNSVRHQEPPEEKFARLRLQREYVDYWLAKETRAFQKFRESLANQEALASKYTNLPGVGPDAIEQLKSGKLRIEKLRSQLQEIDKELEDSPEAHREREGQRRREEADTASRDRWNNIMHVTID